MIPGDEPETTQFGLVLCRDAVRDKLADEAQEELYEDSVGELWCRASHAEYEFDSLEDVIPVYLEKTVEYVDEKGETESVELNFWLMTVEHTRKNTGPVWTATYRIDVI